MSYSFDDEVYFIETGNDTACALKFESDTHGFILFDNAGECPGTETTALLGMLPVSLRGVPCYNRALHSVTEAITPKTPAFLVRNNSPSSHRL
jgi:hypothetical protein